MKVTLRKSSLWILSVTLFLLCLEAGTYGVHWILQGAAPTREGLLSPLSQPAGGFREEEVPLPRHVSNKVLHPFLGFSPDPSNPSVNELGLFGESVVFERKPGQKVVGIFGGSVALGLCGFTGFPPKLREIFPGQRIKLICLAVDGYKQPQQLQALSYVLSLGAVFDIIINLDGFNEIALEFQEPETTDWFRFYPRNWELYSAKVVNSRQIALTVSARRERQRLDAIARLANSLPCRWSFACLTLQRALYLKIEKDLLVIQNQFLQNVLQRKLGVENETPRSQIVEGLVGEWSRASRLMGQLCRSNDIEYYHFLQPNQYYAGSKPLSAKEQVSAIGSDSPLRRAVGEGYPLLIRAGQELVREGWPFHDLSQVFQDRPETLYVDPCCHFNSTGYEILTSSIVRLLQAG